MKLFFLARAKKNIMGQEIHIHSKISICKMSTVYDQIDIIFPDPGQTLIWFVITNSFSMKILN